MTFAPPLPAARAEYGDSPTPCCSAVDDGDTGEYELADSCAGGDTEMQRERLANMGSGSTKRKGEREEIKECGIILGLDARREMKRGN